MTHAGDMRSKDNLLWHGDTCVACYEDLTDAFYSHPHKEDEKASLAKYRLKKWVAGFETNKASGVPYIASDEYRRLIFPSSQRSAALEDVEFQVLLTSIARTDADDAATNFQAISVKGGESSSLGGLTPSVKSLPVTVGSSSSVQKEKEKDWPSASKSIIPNIKDKKEKEK